VLSVLTGEAYHVEYWMPYDGNYGFHDSAWQTFPYGSQQYRTAGSHGCVHLPLSTMAWLYNWAKLGATVTIKA
jgi:lipoprotein-anchoring transpeptidase ErfK/SrfK